jgi:hypothetical protein
MTIEPRLAASVQVSAFLRLAQQQGDFATIMQKGDPTSGAILLVGVIRGANPMIYERFPSIDGPAKWEKLLSKNDPSTDEISAYLKKRSARDPDLWIIELDTADQQRLTLLIG